MGHLSPERDRRLQATMKQREYAADQLFTAPPSTAITCPVTKSLSDDARNTSVPRMPCGYTSRLIAPRWTALSREVFTWPGLFSTTLSESVKPGASVFTQMPEVPTARESERVKAMIAPFEVV